jgi:glycerol uptake facilitator-like aquaporin
MMFHFIGSISPTPIANSMALMVLVYYTAKTSGAHLNPALSLTFTLLGHTNPLEMLFYWIAQITGCAIGALWIALLVPGLGVRQRIEKHAYDGCFIPRSDLSNAAIFGWEAFTTFCFIVPIFSVVWYTTHKKGYGNTGPIMIGFSLFASALAAGPFTGAALNPARVLGSPIVFDCMNRSVIFYYIIGELCGAALVPLVIMPWYGISREAWYIGCIPNTIRRKMKYYQPSLKIDKNEDVLGIEHGIDKDDSSA